MPNGGLSDEYWREVRRTLDANAEHLVQVIVTLVSGDKVLALDPYQLSLGSNIIDVYHPDGSVTKFPIQSICSVTYTIED